MIGEDQDAGDRKRSAGTATPETMLVTFLLLSAEPVFSFMSAYFSRVIKMSQGMFNKCIYTSALFFVVLQN